MMSVDLDSTSTYLVADTSVLLQSLPMVRAIIESNQHPYTLYVPYIVLTELDRGSSAAPVNRLLCRHMKQSNPRVLAQNVSGHKDVSVANGVAAKNDDLILGAALRLRDDGRKTIMLTNDNNLSMKCCANGLTTWSSLDLMCRAREAISEMDRFIAKEFRELCPHVQQAFAFCTELFMCALKIRLKKQDELTSTTNGLVHRLIEKATEEKIVDKQLLARCSQLVKEFRKKPRQRRYDDVQRLLRYVCAILELLKQDKTIAKILNVCKGIFAALKSRCDVKTAGHSLGSSINAGGTKKRFETLSVAQKKNVATIVAKVDTIRKKSTSAGIKKNTSRRKVLPKIESSDFEEEVEEDDDRLIVIPMTSAAATSVSASTSASSSQVSPRASSRRVSTPQKQKLCISRSPPARREAATEMEVDSADIRPGDDVKDHPVYRMLETAWTSLHNISGTWASRCGLDYVWEPNMQEDLKVELITLKDFADCLGQIDADYSRLLKLGKSVAPELLLEVSKRFSDNLRKVCATSLAATPQDIVQFFQDDRTSDILMNGRAQLQVFREAVVRCRNMEAQKVLQRLSTEKHHSPQS